VTRRRGIRLFPQLHHVSRRFGCCVQVARPVRHEPTNTCGLPSSRGHLFKISTAGSLERDAMFSRNLASLRRADFLSLYALSYFVWHGTPLHRWQSGAGQASGGVTDATAGQPAPR